jgi:hypothetical protein
VLALTNNIDELIWPLSRLMSSEAPQAPLGQTIAYFQPKLQPRQRITFSLDMDALWASISYKWYGTGISG